MIKQLDKWRKTKLGLLIVGLVELLIAYGFVGLSIDRGNLWWYLLTLIFLIAGLKSIGRLIGKLIHVHKAD